LPADPIEPLELGKPASISCRVKNVYPKPSLRLTHTLREHIQTSVTETDVTDPLEEQQNPYHLYSILATYNFTPVYSDHNQKLTCAVDSTGTGNSTISDTYALSVNGTFC
jgi:hypothetical protein